MPHSSTTAFPGKLACLISLVAASRLIAADYFVSTTGSDANDGLSLSSPFRNIARAINAIQAGDTIHVRGDGAPYAERVAFVGKIGTAELPITLQTHEGDPPAILDLTGWEVPQTDRKEGILRIENSQFIKVHRMVFRNFKTAGTNAQQRLQIPTGIYVNATAGNTCSDITLSQCQIHGIWTNFPVKYDLTGNAHGIIVMGRSAIPISRIIIDSCHLHDLRLGASEALTLNGNVTDFRVTNNVIHDCNNIGIDFIGHESTYVGDEVPNVSEDRARHGVCRWNRVFRIDSSTNPAYGGNFAGSFPDEASRTATRAAGGIYVDGGRNVEIVENDVEDCNIGIEVASEHFGKFASNCQVISNRVHRCHVGGVFLGGGWTGNGGVENILVTGNTLTQNDTARAGAGQVRIGNLVNSTTISGNVMVASTNDSGLAPFFIMKYLKNGAFFIIDHNIYAGVPVVNGVPQRNVAFDWNDSFQITFSGWKQVSGKDTNSRFVSLPVPKSITTPSGHTLRLFEPMAGQ
ncbi:MAG: right-handed parallel beta-helix repeat-containing protein [Verrucomicrobiaceae bacterium]|nr:right-handed parallel beta-helix repeat-containing protein [Verrucomicrobiaceae bacterium]